MDIKKSKKNKSNSTKFLGLIVLGVLIALVVSKSMNNNIISVKRSELLISSVKKGDVQVEIEAYGSLHSDRQMLVNSLSDATVQEIVLKPGALVTSESVIVRLFNPVLQQELESAKQELAQSKANLRQLKLGQELELLNESSSNAEMEASYEMAKAKLEAEKGLIESGIISKLGYRQSQLQEAQFSKLLAIHNNRIAALELINQEAINIQLEQIKLQQGKLDIAQSRIDSLTVKANFDGVLQRLSVELGQNLVAGQEIALIGSVQDLIALVRVPQNRALEILVGHKAVVDTRHDKISGTVSRIAPVVADNTVEVEIALPAKLPMSARPMQNVDAVIITKILDNIAYIERPVNIQANSDTKVFLVDEASKYAEKTDVRFGKSAGRYIEILEGVKVNDKLIISDVSLIDTVGIKIENY